MRVPVFLGLHLHAQKTFRHIGLIVVRRDETLLLLEKATIP
jgi:hypothetical protein